MRECCNSKKQLQLHKNKVTITGNKVAIMKNNLKQRNRVAFIRTKVAITGYKVT